MSRERDSMFRGNNNDCRIYVGNLPEDCRERDVEDIFYKYGRIGDIRIKRGDATRARQSRRGENLSYAFVQFEDSRDAEDAVRGRDGYEFDGRRVRVEFTRGSQNNRRDSGRSYGNSGGYGGGGRSGRGVPPRRSNNRVLVKGLPPTGSWQDIKDHMREAGEVLYAEVYGDGSGIVEFAHSDDVRYAVKNLDDTEFRSHESETSRVTVTDDSGSGGGGGRKKSYSRSRSRSRSRSGKRSRSRSKDRRSRSRSKSKSRDQSRSRSKSPAKSRSRSPSPRD